MASDEALRRLSTLSPRERDVLALRCDDWLYKEIAKELNLSDSTVKAYMGRIYVKLGLDQLKPRSKAKILSDVFCPLLKTTPPENFPNQLEPPAPEPDSVPEEVKQMVEEDEKTLVLYQAPKPPAVSYPLNQSGPKPPIVIEPRDLPARNPWIRLWFLIGGIAIGTCAGAGVIGGLVWALGGFSPASATVIPPSSTSIVLVSPVVVTQPVTVVVTTTPEPATITPTPLPATDAATDAPSDTAEPTLPPSPTPGSVPTDTPPGTVLGVGDGWLQNGVFLRLVRYSLWPESSYENIGIWFDLYNYTGADLLLSSTKNDFIVTTGTGRTLEVTGFQTCLTNPILLHPAGSLAFECGDAADLGVRANLSDPSIQEINVRVLSFSSRIQDARFQFTIGR